jgi:hypothetical protein
MLAQLMLQITDSTARLFTLEADIKDGGDGE